MRNCRFLFNFMSSFSRKNVYGGESPESPQLYFSQVGSTDPVIWWSLASAFLVAVSVMLQTPQTRVVRQPWPRSHQTRFWATWHRGFLSRLRPHQRGRL